MKLDAVQAARCLAASGDAFLVSRGVRTLAISGVCENQPKIILERFAMLRDAAQDTSAQPFLLAVDGWVYYGFYLEPWALRLYEWLKHHDSTVPKEQADSIYGMLFGYAPPAISEYLCRTRKDP